MSNERNERILIVEALYKAQDLGESDKVFDNEIKTEVLRINQLTEAQFEDQFYQYIKKIILVRERIDKGEDITSAFRLVATGTGLLISIQKTIRSIRMARNSKLPLGEMIDELTALNDIRIRRMRGTDEDLLSQLVTKVIQG